jgi:hypothetical protein
VLVAFFVEKVAIVAVASAEKKMIPPPGRRNNKGWWHRFFAFFFSTWDLQANLRIEISIGKMTTTNGRH